MTTDRAHLVDQVLGLRSELYRSLRPAREWLEVDLTTSQLKVLFLLFSTASASMGQLAASLGVTLSTVTGIVDRLVEHGMVVREEDPHDRRLVVCRLAPAGVALAERLNHAGNSRLRAVLDRLSLPQLRCVVDGLQLLTDAAHAEAAQDDPAPLLAGGAPRGSTTCAARPVSGALLSR
ncbi:MAG TPA: MarR family transcriptional regulator [Chloroflexota bacterium]|nr:MarR family transcriptional regulator [Chloroflexota bacterium]